LKKAKIVIRRLSPSGQHGYLTKSNEWTVDPKKAQRFDSMLPAVKAAALNDLEEGYDYLWMR
jgi:ATP-dependent RNA circularization protein (DNA/RNA ligase family)